MLEPQPPSTLEDWCAQYRLPRVARDDRADGYPYLKVHAFEVYVRDQDQSLQFYLERLGFKLVVDARLDSGERWVAVVPSCGSAVLALIKPTKDSEVGMIGRRTGVTLVTEDITAKCKEWSGRGVRFPQPPTPVPWGIHASFEDIDGNLFNLMQNPVMVEILNAARRSAEERREAERLAALEMEIARQVQARLFPQRLPPLETLEYAGTCLQAQVGGDYYDFLDLGPRHLALVAGDVAGKGIAGALLMANLQASLRSRLRQALEGLPQLLKSVNRLLYENTAENSYATLFFAEYRDKNQRLCYVNCGHYPGLLLRRNQTVERLGATCTILGAFDRWECTTAEVQLTPGDTLLLYTDGTTEAVSDDGREFGEEGLLDILRTDGHLPVPQLLERILREVQEFSRGKQGDDITLVIARCHLAS